MRMFKVKVISLLAMFVIGLTWGLVFISLANGFISDIETIFIISFSAFSLSSGAFWGMVTAFSIFGPLEPKEEQPEGFDGVSDDNTKI